MTLETAQSVTEEVRVEQQWAAAGEQLVAANLVEKLIEAKERELQGCIALNYSRVREVEKELAQLQLQLRITAGPKRSALELIRKKIELQNAKVVAARDRYKVAKQAASLAEETLQAEERVKQRLCQELNILVQQSATAQLDKLEQLTQRLQHLNQGIGSQRRQTEQLQQGNTQLQPTSPHANGQALSTHAQPDDTATGPSHAAATPQQPTSPAPSPAQNAHPPQHSSAAGPPQHVAANTGAPPPVSQPSPEAIAARSRHVGLPTQGEAHSLRQEGMRKPSPRRQMSAGSRQQQGQPAASQGRFSGFD